MDDTPAQENPAKDFNKLDLSQLQGFSFGTQWTQDKASAPERRERSDRPRREGGGERRDGGAPERRDRRSFQRPAAPRDGDAPAAPAPAEGAPAPRREFNRGPRRDFGGEQRGPRRDGRESFDRGERGGPRRDPIERGPYDSPFFNVAFYPEDTSFNALARTIRSSCRTIELFEIARTVVEKTDRFVVVLTRKTSGADAGPGRSAPAGDATAKQPIYLSVPDGVPFESEDAAVAHVLTKHLDKFFELADVEIDPPKGNFQVINKCGVTGELLGPPNYHRYAHIVQQHHAAKVARMPFEAFRSRIETVRDPEAVAQWLEKMKKTTRYTWKASIKPAPAAPAPTVAPDPENPVATEAAAEVAVQEGSTTPETSPAITFDAFEDARSYLLSNAREKIVRAVESARFHGKLVEAMPPGEIRRAIEGALERQRRFPLDTANALRGRLRREHFTIFKKGSKGISYVCAVKRKFRVPGQTFSDTISALIAFVEANPMVRASELSAKFLGIQQPVAPAAPSRPAAEADAPAEAPAAPAPAEPSLSIDDRARISRMQGDLRWLVAEGYVTEFIDGRLFAPPPMVEARKKEVEAEEHDPENFPEAPPEPKPAPAAAETAPAEPAASDASAPHEVAESATGTTPPAEAAAAESEPAPAAAEPAPAAEPAAPAEPAPDEPKP